MTAQRNKQEISIPEKFSPFIQRLVQYEEMADRYQGTADLVDVLLELLDMLEKLKMPTMQMMVARAEVRDSMREIVPILQNKQAHDHKLGDQIGDLIFQIRCLQALLEPRPQRRPCIRFV